MGVRSKIEATESNHYPCPPLATTDCGEAGRCDPVRSSVGPYAEYAVVDGGMAHLLLFSNTLPPAINSIEPNMVDISDPVVVNVELADFWGYFRRWGCNVVGRRSGVPDGFPRRARAKWSLLLEWSRRRHRVRIEGRSGGGSGGGGDVVRRFHDR